MSTGTFVTTGVERGPGSEPRKVVEEDIKQSSVFVAPKKWPRRLIAMFRNERDTLVKYLTGHIMSDLQLPSLRGAIERGFIHDGSSIPDDSNQVAIDLSDEQIEALRVIITRGNIISEDMPKIAKLGILETLEKHHK